MNRRGNSNRGLAVGLPLLLAWSTAAFAAQPPLPDDASGAVRVGGRTVFVVEAPVGSISVRQRADIINVRIQGILTDPTLDPTKTEVRWLDDGTPAVMLDDFPIIAVTYGDVEANGRNAQDLAEEWARVLRSALVEVKPLYRPSQSQRLSFFPLLLVSLLAFGVPLLASRFRKLPVPVVVGEILVGIIIGRSGLNLIHYDSWIQFLAEFGFAYLMFLSGLEVDFNLLAAAPEGHREAKRYGLSNPVILAVLTFSLTLLLSGCVSMTLAGMGLLKHPWMMTLVLSTTSLGLVVPILKEQGYTSTSFGQTLLVTAFIADFITMFLITIVAGWLVSGLTLKLFLGLLLIGAFAVALRVGRALTRSPQLNRLVGELAHATAQIQVRGSLALMLVFVALSEQLGAEVILGAFLAGVLLSLFTNQEGSDLRPKLEALGFGFFIPIFFIMVGVRFNLQALVATPQSMVMALLLIVAAFLIKIGAALPLRSVVSWRETLAGGFLISSRLSLIIAATEVGLRLGLFTESLHAAVICVALVTCIGGPLGFQTLTSPLTRYRRRNALIVGAGEYGLLLSERLQNQEWEVTLLEREPSVTEAAQAAGFHVIQGDGADPRSLQKAGIEEAETLIAATPSDAVNEAICLQAGDFGVPHRLALVHESERAGRLRAQGVLPVTPLLSTVVVLEGMVTHPVVFNLLTESTAEKRITEVVLGNPELEEQALRDVRWPGDVLVLSIQRDGEVLVPHGTTTLRMGDTLTLIGTDQYVQEAFAWVAR